MVCLEVEERERKTTIANSEVMFRGRLILMMDKENELTFLGSASLRMAGAHSVMLAWTFVLKVFFWFAAAE